MSRTIGTGPRAYLVWCPERDQARDDARSVRAHGHAAAAATWAEWDDVESVEYSIARGNDVLVCVAAEDSAEIVRFRVSGETVAQYRAVAVEESTGKGAA